MPLKISACLAVLMMGLMSTACASAGDTSWVEPSYGQAYGKVWHDGKAEMAHYKLTYPRYGEMRDGTAVAITVTEPFLHDDRVKADRPGKKDYGVVKLNLVEDYATGVYDYNQMASVFVATKPVHGMPAGSASKVSFSAQEWCGHAYQQVLFGRPTPGKKPLARHELHSYFDGEADQQSETVMPKHAIAEDALYLWARGLAGPQLKAGESIDVSVYRSLAVQRLRHQGPAWDKATLTRQAGSETVTVPAGVLACEVYTAEVAGKPKDRDWKFYVDASTPDRRLVKVTRSDGYSLELVAVERMAYWQLNREGHESELKKLKLTDRPAGTM